MSKEKSQLENINLPPQDGEATQDQQKSSALPPGFSLGRQLITKDKPTPRSETLKYSLPNYQSGVDRVSQEEKENKARVEKEGMNYDLYLLIKETLVPEFQEKLKNLQGYDILKKDNLFELIEKNPSHYTPNPKDIQFIADNLKEFFPKVKEHQYPYLGIFLNSFIRAYFNSVSKEEREGLKLFLPNTEELDYIGAELSFGELEVIEAGKSFGYRACGSAILEAKEAADFAGQGAYENAHIIVKEAGYGFGNYAHGSAILEAEEAGVLAGQDSYENVHITIKRAGNRVGDSMHGDVTITIIEKYGSVSENRKDNAQIILPDGRVLKAGDSA